MRTASLAALPLCLLPILPVSPAHAQDNGWGCDDYADQAAAQSELVRDPSDPYGLDPDGNGVACDHEPTADAEAEAHPLDARIGGTIESWEAEYGPPIKGEGEAADLFTEYDLPGYSTVFADEHLGRIHRISLYSPRPEGEEWSKDEPHEMDWTVRKAHELARRFLPRDAEVFDPDEDRVGGIMTECESEALRDEVPTELYDYVDNTPVYGGCSYWLDVNLGDEGHVSNITVELEIEERLDSPANRDDDEDAASDAEDAGAAVSAEERAYALAVAGQAETISESMSLFTDLMQAPRIGEDDWTIQLAGVLVTWRFTYEEALALTPPPAFAEVHAVYLDALGYLVAAADDIEVGIDTFDVARLSQAAVNLDLATQLLAEVERLVREISAERGL